MKRIVFFLLILFAFINTTIGKKVTIEKAKQVAENFYLNFYNRKATPGETTFSLASEIKTNDTSLIYIFNLNNKRGFIIVTSDNNLFPILGFSPTGKYSDDISKPPEFIYWLDDYTKQIKDALRENYDNEINKENWRLLSSYSNLSVGDSMKLPLSTKWGQDIYYNTVCPSTDGILHPLGPDNHCWVGCVATAMGQILKYFNYPPNGFGQHSYYDLPNITPCVDAPYFTISTSFGEQIPWNNMTDSLNSYNPSIEQLLSNCGIIVNMDYAACESGAQQSAVSEALTTHLNYASDIAYIMKQDHLNDWESILVQEITNERPIQYEGHSGNSGHSFICMGYKTTIQGNQFLINWGWKGDADGWFSMTNINTYYPSSQAATIHIHPSQQPDLFFVSSSVTPTSIQQGQFYTVNFTLKNGGTVNAVPSTVKYYLSTNSTYESSDTYLGSTEIETLNINDQTSKTIELFMPGVQTGSYYLLICADANHCVHELNESDNISPIPITVTQITALYDGLVSPSQGNTTTSFQFSAYFIGSQAPQYVKAIGSTWSLPMTAGGSNYSNGVQFTASNTFTVAGQYPFYFEAKTSSGQILRYPQTGNLTLNVTQSAVGWDLAVMSTGTIFTPANVQPGTNITVTAAVKNQSNAGNTYTNVLVSAQLKNSSGSIVAENSTTITSLAPGITGYYTIPVTMPSSASNGSYQIVVQVFPTLDYVPANNSQTLGLYMGPAMSNEQFEIPNGSVGVNQNGTISIPQGTGSNTFTLWGINTSQQYATFKAPDGNLANIYTDHLKLYSSYGAAIANEFVDAGPPAYAEVKPGNSVSNGPVFSNTLIETHPGQTAVFTATAPSGKYFISNYPDDYPIFVTGTTSNNPNLVKDWLTNAQRSNNNTTLTLTFTIPSTATTNTYLFYIITPYNTGTLEHMSRLNIQVDPLPPAITSLSIYTFSADDQITITGTNFSTTTGSVKFYNNLNASIVTWSNTQIKCKVPNGVQNGNLCVVNSVGTSNSVAYQVISSTGDPVVVQPIPDQSMNQNSSLVVATLTNVFWDPNNDPLVYTASSSSPNITWSITSGILTLTTNGIASGTNQITVSATDADNVTVQDVFQVTVIVPPLISLSATSLSNFGNVLIGSTSSSQFYTISGNNLMANISVTAPTGFQISFSSSTGYTNQLTLTQTGGSVPIDTIYIRFNPTLTGAYSGNITNVSSGATTQYIAVNGTGTCVGPTPSFTASPGSTVCISDNVTYTTQPNQLNYVWLVDGLLNTDYNIVLGGIGSASNTVTLKWLTAGIKTVRVNYSNTSGCPGANSAVSTTSVSAGLPSSISITAFANPICSGTTVTYTATPTNGGTSPSYQWKKNGSNIGTNSNTFSYAPVNNDIITCVLTSNASCATGSPATSNSVTMIVNPIVPVSVAISPSANPACSGTSVTFTATPTNGGTSPSYQWKKNGANAGTNSTTYSYTPANNDIITCVLTSNASCISGSPATSNAVNMVVNPVVPVSVSISPSANPVCVGTAVTYTAVPVNGGTSPSYQWMKNGTTAGTNSSSFSYVPANNDQVYCILTSNANCPSGNPFTSNVIGMSVSSSLPVSIAISPSANSVCAGTTVTFTATPTNGGTSPSYQWKKNGNNIGTNSNTFSYVPANNDVITCVLTSNASCATGSPATSNSVTMIVNPLLPVSVAILPSANPVCSGTSVTFTATPTNGGTSPSYQWKKNGINVGTNTPVYSYTPSDGDVITCVLTSNVTCPGGNPATSNAVTMVLMLGLSDVITIEPSANPVCTGNSVTFTATQTNGGTSPFYQWKKNGINTGTNSPTFSYTPANGDVITCIMTPSSLCALPNPATSNSVTMSVNSALPTSLSISGLANPVCAGASVTFTATPTNGGTSPSYQWKKNGSNVGTNSSTYSYAPANNDVITCILTSNASCATGSPATSNSITMMVNSTVPVSLSVSPSANPICSGSSVTMTATPTNGGTSPAYQWKKNGINAGTNSSTYSYIPTNNDIITCTLTSNASCPSGNPALSNAVTLNVMSLQAVSISISPSSNPVCSGNTVTFSATPANGGSSPSYQWKKNGSNFGTNSNTLSYTPSNNDIINCILTSNTNCPSGNPATSNSVSMVVSSSLPTSVTVSPSANPVCAGTTVNFTATPVNGGSAPGYTWTRNGIIAVSNTSTYSCVPSNNDVIKCVLTSNYACATGNPASFSVTMSVINGQAPAQPGSISGSTWPCQGSTQTYAIQPVAGATTYNWHLPFSWSGSSTLSSITCTTGTVGGTIMVTAKNTCGESPASIINVDPTRILVTPAVQNLPGTALSSTVLFNIYSSTSWSAISDQTWCSVTPSGSGGNGTLSVALTQNTLSTTRSANITVNYNCATPVIIKVNQAGTSDRTLNLTLFLQGLFNGATMNKTQNDWGNQFPGLIADSMTVELHNSTSPYALNGIPYKINLNTDGTATAYIPSAYNGNYYVVAKNRNHLETWSSTPKSFASSPVTVNFSTSASSAYGNNLQLLNGKYCLFGGDVNSDGIIDGSDMSPVDNMTAIYATGYLEEDINGDGLIDASDMSIIDNNVAQYIGLARP